MDTVTECSRCHQAIDDRVGSSRDHEGCPFEPCDDLCLAPIHPQGEAELRLALEHWRYHGYLAGCSHAR